MDSLRAAATPLIELCSRDVAEQIETVVQQTVQEWNETAANLTQLCDRYQRAVRLWNNYKTATESLSECIEQQITNLDTMDANDTVKFVEDYTRNLPGLKQRLAEVQKLVDGIATEIELDSTNLLTMEVDVMTKKLEHIQTAITKLADFADEKAKRWANLEEDLQRSSVVLEDVEKVSEKKIFLKCDGPKNISFILISPALEGAPCARKGS